MARDSKNYLETGLFLLYMRNSILAKTKYNQATFIDKKINSEDLLGFAVHELS